MMSCKISILVTSRVQGNINHALVKLLDSLEKNSYNPFGFEVLVKFDYDDEEATYAIGNLNLMKYSFDIKFCRGERGRGYIDIHHGYNQLLTMLNPESIVVGAMADDFVVLKNWDRDLLEAIEGAGDYFIVHQRTHPYLKMENGKGWCFRPDPEVHKFYMDTDMFDAENLHVVDEAPFWSRGLLKEFQDMGDCFPISFTDAWTICLEWVLWNEYKQNITKFMPGVKISRVTCDVDQPGHPRWDTDRRWNFDYIKSNEYRKIIFAQSERVNECLTRNLV